MLEALDEPALLVAGTAVLAGNRAALQLFGAATSGSDVRLIIRHPLALEQILSATPGDVEVAGIGGAGRPWIIAVRPLPGNRLLVRLNDTSALRAAEKMRVDFVANASHELRTPLATILGYAETIAEERDLDPKTSADFGSTIRAEAKRMLRIVEDLMSLSRIEADRFIAPGDPVDVGELARAVAEQARLPAESRGCNVVLDMPPELPTILGDEAQLTQMLDNLVMNALRYGCTRAGCAVRVSAVSDENAVVLTIADTGEGIAREHLPRLTERFYRVDAARSRDSGGTGLGLAIVKHIVERHRGTLEIRSAVGAGTQVAVRLPAA